ncbi:alpha/beta fold hydrolase [Nakamurella sp. YIM 132087]|uniref:Alpha/beta fold hydrolase n=1 Tax=Nakamurella alba TaxID=2665158 RepID=A0A7K1FKF7_9ACTN|nr:alpha/beta hydrolase [Nakamurella alba]MTD14625.1 alpha/beta fold hydrolase [Nakamurella alba]
MSFFPGFTLAEHDVGPGIRLRYRTGGQGPAVVLLHGHPRTHTTWYRVAPALADAGFTVVCPDLRGYGGSSTPTPSVDHAVHSDREMAGDIVALMDALGHQRFAVIGHDRGSYVAYRKALDHPARVTALAVLDSVPILEALERADARFAEKWWHWFFFASDQAERVITADPLAWYRLDAAIMGAHNHADVVAAVTDPATVRAMLEDYRAGLHVDRDADLADRDAGRRITCPTLVAWSAHDDIPFLYDDPAAIWQSWCTLPVRTAVVDSGHHMAEENPEHLAEVLLGFLTDTAPSGR